jgi:hypothetical protein
MQYNVMLGGNLRVHFVAHFSQKRVKISLSRAECRYLFANLIFNTIGQPILQYSTSKYQLPIVNYKYPPAVRTGNCTGTEIQHFVNFSI